MNREFIDSGIEWIGHIPPTWKMIPNKYLFIEHCKKVGDNWKNYQLLSLTTKGIKEKDINSSGGKVPESYDNYQIVTPGDMVFCLFDLDVSAVFSGLSNLNGMITSAYNVCSVNNRLICESYANYWFQYVFSNRYYKIYSKNIRYTVTSDNFGLIKSPCPPINEQKCIGNYLDRKISQIDKLIANQEKQIEKLNEYKQSVITKAVTKGLDPNVEMKDSGVEWIGKYNSNYQIIKMKKITYMKGRIGWQGLTSSDFIDEGPYCITGTDFYNGKVDWSRCYHVSNERYNMDEKIQVKVGDLLITKDGTIGKLAIIDELPNKACLNSHLLIIRPLNNMFINEYLYYVLSSKIFVKYYSLIGSGKTTMNSLSQEQIGDFSFPCPSIDEQLIIANYLSNKCLKINSLLNIKKNKIYKLNEYKKSLIYEYVTGKKQVA